MIRRLATAGAFAGMLVASLAACAPAADDRPLVMVSTNILGDVVGELVGGEAQVVTLMRPNADPHSFEISGHEAARLRAADLVVSNGLGLDEGLQQHLDAAGIPDPHFWTDPARMADVVEALVPVLSALPGVDADTVAAHADEYAAELSELDAEMTEAFEAIPESTRALVTNHHVFGYLADRFGFRVIGAVIPGGTTLAAPSASDLADLVSAVEQTRVRTIFAESSSPDRLMRALADEANVHVDVVELYTESLTEAGGGAEDYLTMMRVNTERIATGLSS